MKGFYEVVPFNFIKNLDEKDLGLKLAGVNKIDVQEMKSNALYEGGFAENDQVV